MGYYGDFESEQAEQAAFDHTMEEQKREAAALAAYQEEEYARQSKLTDFIFSDKI